MIRYVVITFTDVGKEGVKKFEVGDLFEVAESFEGDDEQHAWVKLKRLEDEDEGGEG